MKREKKTAAAMQREQAKKNMLFILIILVLITLAIVMLIFKHTVRRMQSSTEPPTVAPTKVAEISKTPSEENLQPEGDVAEGMVIELSQPADYTIVTESYIIVQGKTAPGAEVFVNDIELKADEAGNFSTSVPLDEGDNLISVSANDEAGNYAEKEVLVTYQPTTQ